MPDTVRDAVLISAAELPGAAREAAEVAAVAGESFDLAVVAALSSDDGVDRADRSRARARGGRRARRRSGTR